MGIAVQHDNFDDLRLSEGLGWWDADAGCRLIVSQPGLDPQLWAAYGRGAVHSYRRHGVECALDMAALDSGADTIMFFVVVDEHDRMLAGVRAKGPLHRAEDSHALIEWHDHPAQPAVHKMITERLAYGILEMKSAWVAETAPRCEWITKALARSGFHMMALLDVQFCMATAAAYVLNRWRSSGGVIAPIAATAYPDHRYQTKMMWWDRRTFTTHAQPQQAAKILTETNAITASVRNTEPGRETPAK